MRRYQGLVVCAAACAELALAIPVLASERLAVRLTPLAERSLREARFSVSRPVTCHVVGTGSGSPRRLSEFAWVLDLDSRKPAWSMTGARSQSRDNRMAFDEKVTLAPGRYAAYFYSSRHMKVTKAYTLLKGMLQGEPGTDGDEFLELWLDTADMDALTVAESAAPAGMIRLAPLSDDRIERRRFRLDQPASVRILAMGERGNSSELADQSWLIHLESREVVWSFDTDKSVRPAGGAAKNEIVDRNIDLAAGNYELVAITDDSHSSGRWNATPPWNPDDWGVTLWLPGAVSVESELPEERIILRLTDAGDDESLTATFRLERETRVRVVGIGEWSQSQEELVDRGWIEPAAGGAPVWTMTFDRSIPAGGAWKNRMIDQGINLPAGTWRARFESDDSHSKAGWNAARPLEPRRWGLTVSTFDTAAPFELLELRAAGRRGHNH